MTIDHVPPRAVFRGKHRPKGLEFASCKRCNEGTSHADLAASLLSRVAPDAADDQERADLQRVLSGVSNNIPGLLEEMFLDGSDQAEALNGSPSVESGFLRANGALMSAYMQTFATKLGFALYYELTRSIVPVGGGVAARLFSNVDWLEGTFPQSVFDILLAPMTLKQGTFEVSDQFSYQWRLAEGDRMGLFFASFRQSFAVLAFVTTDVRLFDIATQHPMQIVSPGKLTELLESVKS